MGCDGFFQTVNPATPDPNGNYAVTASSSQSNSLEMLQIWMDATVSESQVADIDVAVCPSYFCIELVALSQTKR